MGRNVAGIVHSVRGLLSHGSSVASRGRRAGHRAARLPCSARSAGVRDDGRAAASAESPAQRVRRSARTFAMASAEGPHVVGVERVEHAGRTASTWPGAAATRTSNRRRSARTSRRGRRRRRARGDQATLLHPADRVGEPAAGIDDRSASSDIRSRRSRGLGQLDEHLVLAAATCRCRRPAAAAAGPSAGASRRGRRARRSCSSGVSQRTRSAGSICGHDPASRRPRRPST